MTEQVQGNSSAATASGFDLKATEDEWRKAPADLAEWSMRAMRMLRLAAVLEKEVEMHRGL